MSMVTLLMYMDWTREMYRMWSPIGICMSLSFGSLTDVGTRAGPKQAVQMR
jgi:hypothetical protein